MANKREIADDIRRQYGNVMSQNQVKKYLGMGDHEAQEFLRDVPFMRESRKKKFLTIDVARKIHENLQTVV